MSTELAVFHRLQAGSPCYLRIMISQANEKEKEGYDQNYTTRIKLKTLKNKKKKQPVCFKKQNMVYNCGKSTNQVADGII